jgi:sugar phosphate isomerase/epimerase
VLQEWLSLDAHAVAFGSGTGIEEAAQRAADLGFDHLDASAPAVDRLDSAELANLAVPIGDRIAGFDVVEGCTSMAPFERRGEDRFDETVELFRNHPGARLEPGPRSAAAGNAKVEAIVAAVPGLRLTLDTGHVATWGGDPVPLLRHADHVQLRQAAEGRPQLHPDDGGDVDFAAVLAELDRLDYRGRVSIEYFNLPDYGWPLDDPVGHAVALATHVRALM